jgi:opacity protein-like surface antigen
MKKVLFGAFLAILAAATPARAQGDHPVHVNLGGGFTMPVSDVAERFSTGGSFTIGLIMEPTPVFGVQVEYAYNGLAGEDKVIAVAPTPVAIANGTALIESHHNMQYINFNGILRSSSAHAVSPYAIGGAGMYYRSVSLTTPDIGFATYCDPYWYVCYPTAVEIDRIIGDRSGWDPGINLGAGVTFKIGDEAMFYVETRWHYMWGPSFTDRDGNELKANGQYFPVTFGFRF